MHATPLRHLRATLPLVALLALGGCSVGSLALFEQDPAPGEETSATAETAMELDVLLRIAESSRLNGDLASAENVYGRAHVLHPEAAAPLVGLGQVLTESGAHADAVHHLQDAVALAPYNEDAHAALGKALLGAQAPDEALQAFEKLTEINPSDARAWNGAGVALDNLGRHEEAQERYRTGLAYAPEYMSLRNNLGLSLALTGNHEEAIQMLRVAAGEDTATPRTRQNLALALGLAGDLDAARQIGALDLPPEVVDRNLAFFAARRDKAAARRLADRQLAFVPRESMPDVPAAPTEPATAMLDGQAAEQVVATMDVDTAALADVKPAAGLPMELCEQLRSDIPVPPEAPEARSRMKAPPRKPDIASVIQPSGDTAQAISARAPYGLHTFLDRLNKFDQDYELNEENTSYSEASIGLPRALPSLVVHRNTTDAAQNQFEGTFIQIAANNTQNTRMAAFKPDVLQKAANAMAAMSPASEAPVPVGSPHVAAHSTAAAVISYENPMPAVSPAESVAASTAGDARYQVQVSAHRSAAAAHEAWDQITGRDPALFEGIQPLFSRVDLGPDKGVFYRVRTALLSEADAAELCDDLRAAGTACLLIKAPPAQVTAELSMPNYPALNTPAS